MWLLWNIASFSLLNSLIFIFISELKLSFQGVLALWEISSIFKEGRRSAILYYYYYYSSIKVYLALGYDTHPIKLEFNYIYTFAILIASFDILHHLFYAILKLSIPEIKSLI